MGEYTHDAMVVVVNGDDDELLQISNRFHEWTLGLSISWKRGFVGPFGTAANGFHVYMALPDGGKDGGRISAEGDSLREDFKRLLTNGSTDGVTVTFGGPEPYRARLSYWGW